MSGLFRWVMRHGARIVFFVALLQLLAGLLLPLAIFLTETRRMAANYNYSGGGDYDVLLQLSQTLYSLTSFAFLLVGALVIDRADRWLDSRDRQESAE